MKFSIDEIKSRLDIFGAAQKLGLTLQGRNGLYHSPFRQDAHPSFSISKDGQLFNDFATTDKGDLISFYKLATNTDTATAIKDLANMAGLALTPYKEPLSAGATVYTDCGKQAKMRPIIPRLEWNGEYALFLQNTRGYSVESLRIAYERKFFGFCEYNNSISWIVKDRAGNVAQARRLDGKPWLGSVKALTLKNSDCGIPIGFHRAIENEKHIALCEGSTDFLAAFHFAYINDCAENIAPFAMLGAQQRISIDCLDAFKNRRVLIFPDNDAAGHSALGHWGRQIEPYAEKVFYFDFNGFHTTAGEEVKDLSDFIRLDYDEWERCRPYAENPFTELFNPQKTERLSYE